MPVWAESIRARVCATILREKVVAPLNLERKFEWDRAGLFVNFPRALDTFKLCNDYMQFWVAAVLSKSQPKVNFSEVLFNRSFDFDFYFSFKPFS